MAVPETTMNKYDRSPAREHKIRLPWQITPVKTVPETKRMSRSPDDHFRFGIF
jgi:hypothetical protein